MLVSKSVRRSTVVALVAFGVAACSEGPTAPVGMSPDAAPLMAKGGHDDNGGSGNSNGKKVSSRSFTIRPGHAVKEKLGEHTLTMPADAVCDPETSRYGAAFWDLPCNPIEKEIEVTAYWTEYKGDPVIRFKPDLRFVPAGNDESRWVVLTVKHTRGIDPEQYYAILWRNPVTNKWVDESAADASQRAVAKKNLRSVSRRLKHFSDYFIWAGFGSYNVTSGIDEDLFGLGGW